MLLFPTLLYMKKRLAFFGEFNEHFSFISLFMIDIHLLFTSVHQYMRLFTTFYSRNWCRQKKNCQTKILFSISNVYSVITTPFHCCITIYSRKKESFNELLHFHYKYFFWIVGLPFSDFLQKQILQRKSFHKFTRKHSAKDCFLCCIRHPEYE